MPFIPNHRDSCELKRSWETNCPFGCGKRVVYIECTCPRPSKFYLDKSGEGRHDEHECNKMRACAHGAVFELWRAWRGENACKATLAGGMVVVSRILKQLEGWESPSEDKQAAVEQCKRLMREKVAELWAGALRKKWESPPYIWSRIQEMNSDKEFMSMVRRALDK